MDATDRLSKGALQRPKHATVGDKIKGSNTDTQHEEAGAMIKFFFLLLVQCLGESNVYF